MTRWAVWGCGCVLVVGIAVGCSQSSGPAMSNGGGASGGMMHDSMARDSMSGGMAKDHAMGNGMAKDGMAKPEGAGMMKDGMAKDPSMAGEGAR